MPASAFTDAQQHQLLQLAREAIAARLRGTDIAAELVAISQAAPFDQTGASFVTLKKEHQLRGCIGTLEAHRPLGKDVIHNAQAAAFSDPRFTPVSADELQQLQLQISILTQPQPLPAMPEEQLLNFLTPGRDGLVLHEGSHRATFLPAVWESLPKPQHFLQELKRKAGLPSEYWSETMKFETYRTICFGE